VWLESVCGMTPKRPATDPNSGLRISSTVSPLARIGIGHHLLLAFNHNLRAVVELLGLLHLMGLHVVKVVNEGLLLQLREVKEEEVTSGGE
jgi:hypothetical protein